MSKTKITIHVVSTVQLIELIVELVIDIVMHFMWCCMYYLICLYFAQNENDTKNLYLILIGLMTIRCMSMFVYLVNKFEIEFDWLISNGQE